MKKCVKIAISYGVIISLLFFVACGGDSGDDSEDTKISVAEWVDYGPTSSITHDDAPSFEPSLALDSSDKPVVAWENGTSNNDQIYIKRWNGSSWVEMDGSASGGGISGDSGGWSSWNVSLALDSSDNPVAAWQKLATTSTYEIYVKRWDGSSWVEVGTGSATDGGVSDKSGASKRPSLALDSSDNPVVAWSDNTSGNYEIYVKRWNGSSWQDIGGSASGGGISDNIGPSKRPSLALDSSDNPVVAWSDHTSGNREIYIKRWNGISWVEVGTGSATDGGISVNSGHSMRPSLALDSSDNPVVAWGDGSSPDEQIYIKRWNGISWVEVGTGSATDGGISVNSGHSMRPSLALDSSDNPVVAWGDGSSPDEQIYIKRWNGSSWVEVGTGSATDGGISDNSGDSWKPSLALDSSDNPVVAWNDYTYAPSCKIYIKRWDGTSWVEVGTGSATDGGISDDSGDSYYASLALTSSGNPAVAWNGSIIGNWEIYIKRWIP